MAPPNPLSLVLPEGVRESHRVAPMMPKGEAIRTTAADIIQKLHYESAHQDIAVFSWSFRANIPE